MRRNSSQAENSNSDTRRIHLAPANTSPPSKFTRRALLGAAAGTAVGVGLYSNIHARHEYVITHRTFAIRDLPDPFVGFRMVQMSDIHLEGYTEPWFLQKMIAEANALNPDIVVLTGDFISRGGSKQLHAMGTAAELLSTLTAPQRFAILGNHDVGVDAGLVIRELEAHGTPVLVDSYFALERGTDRLWLAGSDDASTRSPDLDLSIPQDPRAPVILLAHEPDFADHVSRHPRFPLIDLMLSGHSHGGQVRLPLLGPLILPPMGKKYVEGHFQFGHMQLYVNRGIGTVGLPFRLNCPAEITHITLERA